MQNTNTVTSAAEYFTNPDGFEKDVHDFASKKGIMSGFANIDAEHKGLYPGLYVLGGISSAGKTTFISQLADNIAKGGTPALIYSMEMTALQMFSKSIARELFIQNLSGNHTISTYTSSQISGRAWGQGPNVYSTINRKAVSYHRR